MSGYEKVSATPVHPASATQHSPWQPVQVKRNRFFCAGMVGGNTGD